MEFKYGLQFDKSIIIPTDTKREMKTWEAPSTGKMVTRAHMTRVTINFGICGDEGSDDINADNKDVYETKWVKEKSERRHPTSNHQQAHSQSWHNGDTPISQGPFSCKSCAGLWR